jgi:hypothetical protein
VIGLTFVNYQQGLQLTNGPYKKLALTDEGAWQFVDEDP